MHSLMIITDNNNNFNNEYNNSNNVNKDEKRWKWKIFSGNNIKNKVLKLKIIRIKNSINDIIDQPNSDRRIIIIVIKTKIFRKMLKIP